MKDKRVIDPQLKIQFPNLLIIPMFSIIGIVLKAFRLTSYDWLDVVILTPIISYFIWCVGYLAIVMMAIWVYKTFKKD